MKKYLFKLFLILAFVCVPFMNIFAKSKESGYSKNFRDWAKLSEERRKEYNAPAPFSISYKKVSDKEKAPGDKEESLPSTYDLRDHIEVEVEDQKNTNQCWAYSAASTAETYLALRGKTYDFSEMHMDYDTTYNFIGSDNPDMKNPYALYRHLRGGGYSTTAFAYFGRGSGPILETEMPDESYEHKIFYSDLPKNMTVQHVENMIYFPNLYKTWNGVNISYVDPAGNPMDTGTVNAIRNSIKEHIMTNGGVSADVILPENLMGYNKENHAAFNYVDNFTNHTVTLIGWDDNYDRNNFRDGEGVIPEHNGAYIALNSWGESWGNNGTYYISYDDLTVEMSARGITKISDLDYDNIYQHDMNEMTSTFSSKYAANVFTASKNETLHKVVIGDLGYQNVNIYVNPSSSILNISGLTKVASNVSLVPGYTTVTLDEVVNLTAGKKFAIVVEILDQDIQGIGIEKNVEAEGVIRIGNVESNAGESYYSSNGTSWNDLHNASNPRNFSIKALTKDKTDSAKVISTKLPNKLLFSTVGGEVNIKVKTTIGYEGKDVTVYVYDADNKNVTSSFEVGATEVKNTLSDVTVTVPKGTKIGTYKVKAYIDSVAVAEKTISVKSESFDTTKYFKSKFNDVNLYNALKKHVLDHKSDLYAYYDDTQELVLSKDIPSLTFEDNVLDLMGGVYFGAGFGITDLTGLGNFPNLVILDLSANRPTTLKPIANLTNLQRLTIYNADTTGYAVNESYKLNDIDVISGFKFLMDLTLTDAQIEDLSFLSGLTELQSLDVQHNLISDIKPLKNLTNLTYLTLDYNLLTSLNDLRGLTNLETLNAQAMEIEDMSPVAYLPNLKHLYLANNRLIDPTYFDNMPNLEEYDFFRQRYGIVTDQRNNVTIPTWFAKVFDSKSVLYSSGGATLTGCEWAINGRQINFTEGSNLCTIKVNEPGLSYNSVVNIAYVNDFSTVTGIEITEEPGKKKYQIGESLNLVGGRVRVTFDLPGDRDEMEFEMSMNMFDISGFDSSSVGPKTVTVSFGTYEDSYVVNVVNSIKNITMKTNPTKTSYNYNEDLDLTGGSILVTTKTGNTSVVDLTHASVSVTGYDKTKVGVQTLTVTYTVGEDTYTTTFKVSVHKSLSGATVTNLNENYNYTGSSIKPSIKVMDGETLLVNGTDYSLTYTNNKNVGKATITIKGIGSYEGTITKTFNIIVGEPTSLVVKGASTSSIKITFAIPSGKVDGYQIYRSLDGETFSRVTNVTTNSYTNTGLTSGTTYYYKVRSYVKIGTSTKFSEFTEVKSARTKVKTPVMSSKKSSTQDSITVRWGAVTGADGYEVYYSTRSTGTYTSLGTTTSTSYKHTGLSTNKTYYYKVRAYQLVDGVKNYSSYSSYVRYSTKLATANITKFATSTSSIRVYWDTVSGAKYYRLYYSPDNSTWNYVTVKNTYTNYSLKSLTSGKVYYFKVIAYKTLDDKNIYGEYSSVKSIPTKVKTPVISSSKSSTQDSITIKWGKVSGATKYEVAYATSSTGTYTSLGTTTSTSFKHTGLSTNKVYYYKVRAIKTYNEQDYVGSYSSYARYSTKLATAVISNVATSTSSIRLTWNKVSGAKYYRVYYSTDGKSFKYVTLSNTVTSYSFKKLTSGKIYYYKVIAYKVLDGKNIYGEYSDVLKMAPKLLTPTAKVVNIAGVGNRLTWNKISGASGYEILYSTEENGEYSSLVKVDALTFDHTEVSGGTTYYYKVSAYKTIDGENYNGSNSKIVKVTTPEDKK